MGEGGYINLVNGTPFPWVKTYEHSYQMVQWSLPNTVPANSTITVYVEWNQHIGKTQTDDGGESHYALQGIPGGQQATFQVQANAAKGFDLRAYYDGLSTPGFSQGSTNSLGWTHDGTVNFVLGGAPANSGYGNWDGFWTTHDPASNWMQRYLPMIGNRPLKDIVMPGSHDSGMSTVSGTTAAVLSCQILNQSKDIGGQLAKGARFFDFRPIINNGIYKTGHYSTVDVLGTVGGNGQAIDDVISEINAFTSTNNELIILDISQDHNTDSKTNVFPGFSSDQWATLMQKFQKLDHRWTGGDQSTDLNTIPLNKFLVDSNGQPQSAVIIIFENGATGLENYNGQGYFPASSWQHKGFYANQDDPSLMIPQQLNELNNKNPNQSFIQYWTLTQLTKDVVGCGFDSSLSVLNLATKARPSLFSTLYPYSVQHKIFPGVLLTDDAGKSDELVALAMAFNFQIPS